MLEPRAVFLFQLPQSLLDKLDKVAYEQGISRSDAARKAIAAYCGISDPTVHGNTKYYEENKKLATKRELTKQRVRRHREAAKDTNTLEGWTDIIMGTGDKNGKA